ncbi:protein FAF-like, chloroplastic [Cornus florida]|uniref:protein FAF-like, chloroplastic n=1 Tax=Cornus florida TaxID=4283 RepID=UPI00289BA0C1|nr:protein FAF-like, chloroplastic [Cornus florida]XP_059659672.1 protein FAF-like, chloroplastic [Cornus florida]
MMSVSLSKSQFRLSSHLKVEEEAHLMQKQQGIVSILGSDCDRSKVAPLRRTLSADMSKWLARDHRPMKKVASSQEFPISSTPDSSSEEEEEDDDWSNNLESRSQSDVWRFIQKEKEKKEMEKAGQFDIWSSILCQKDMEDSAKLPPPYIHPLVKRSSSLTGKSLEICTESLGCETGSDGFSSYPASETGDTEEDGDHQQVSSQPQPPQSGERESLSFDRDEFRSSKHNKKFPPPLRSFPPPLPSLSNRDRLSLHMQSRRENGRLVLEAVSLPSRNYFHAQREDGRLLLTLVNGPPSQEPNHGEAIDQVEDSVEELEEVFGNGAETRSEEEYEEEEEEEGEEEEEEEMVEKENGANKMGIVIEQAVPKVSSGGIIVHRSAFMMKKLMGIENRNSTWSTSKFNKGVDLVDMDVEEDEEEVANPLPQSLPPPTRVARIPTSPASAATTSFNAYEYFWRTNSAGVATMMSPLSQPCPPLKNRCNKVILSNSSPKAYGQQDLVLYRGKKADYLVPFLMRGCKEPRRSLLIWEPYCIATS